MKFKIFEFIIKKFAFGLTFDSDLYIELKEGIRLTPWFCVFSWKDEEFFRFQIALKFLLFTFIKHKI